MFLWWKCCIYLCIFLICDIFIKKKKFLYILSITALLNYSCNIDDKYSKMKELYFRIYYNKMIIKVMKTEGKIFILKILSFIISRYCHYQFENYCIIKWRLLYSLWMYFRKLRFQLRYQCIIILIYIYISD